MNFKIKGYVQAVGVEALAPPHLIRVVDLFFRLRLYFEVLTSQLKGVNDWEELLDDVGFGGLGLDYTFTVQTSTLIEQNRVELRRPLEPGFH